MTTGSAHICHMTLTFDLDIGVNAKLGGYIFTHRKKSSSTKRIKIIMLKLFGNFSSLAIPPWATYVLYSRVTAQVY